MQADNKSDMLFNFKFYDLITMDSDFFILKCCDSIVRQKILFKTARFNGKIKYLLIFK